MNQVNWSNKDYQNGLFFISSYEDKAASKTIIATDKDVTLILPSGLPIYGIGFYGIFMLAPIVLFMITITYFIFIILTANSLEVTTQILLSAGGFFLFWALTKAFKLLISSRELFPMKYFSNFGTAWYSLTLFQFAFSGITPELQLNGIRLIQSVLIPLFFYLGFLLAY